VLDHVRRLMTEKNQKQWQRLQYVGLKNFYTGRVIVIDTFKQRLGTMKSRVINWAYLVDKYRENNQARMVMVTLTYKRKTDYKPGHIRDYLKNIKKRLGKNLLAHAWVAELQQRGAVHYHVILVVSPGSDIPKPDKKGYWTHGMSKIETAKTAYYLAVYTGKEYQKSLQNYPKHCRLYGMTIRPEMVKKLNPDLLEAFSIRKRISIKTAEGESLWEYLGSSVTKEYIEAIYGSEAGRSVAQAVIT